MYKPKLFCILTVLMILNLITTISAKETGYCAPFLQNTYENKHLENLFDYKIDETTKTAVLLKVKDYNSEKIIIPEEVKGCKVIKIASKAFGDPVLKNWKQIILPDSITEIEERAFNFCTNLENIRLSNKLEKIGSECFFCCSNLQKIDVPDCVSFIGESAFYSCISLKKINIPKSLKALENKLFEHCISLNGIYIHENIEKISDNIFDKCSVNLNLAKTKINKNNEFYEIKNNCIINKQNGSEVLRFPINDKNYKNKIKMAKLLYQKIQNFLKMYEGYSFENFEKAFQDFLKNGIKSLKIISKNEFERQSENKLILYRGISNEKHIQDFESGEIYFGTNLENERGCGIYTTSNFLHARFWTFQTNTDWMAADYGNVDLENLNWGEAINLAYERNLLPHGKVLEMFLDDNAKILENIYLLELKDIIYKMHYKQFKNVATFVDVTWPLKVVKDLKIYQTKEELLFHNSGVLTKLLGYDVLYEKEYMLTITEQENEDRKEFLVVNPSMLLISE